MRTYLLRSLAMLLCTIAFVANGNARSSNKTVAVTFHEPVQVPGAVLPPGTYVLERSHPGANPDVVQFLDPSQTRLYGKGLAVPVKPAIPTHQVTLAFTESVNGTDQLARFYIPGEQFGERLIYDRGMIEDRGIEQRAEAPTDLPWPQGGIGFEPSVCRHRDLSKDLEFKLCTQQLSGGFVSPRRTAAEGE